ncbi:phosphoribosylamine--glycine ligase [Bacillaceae bacterium S4-13-56]
MKILVVGRGGREHSLLQKFSESSQVIQLFVAPGNAGMERIATRVLIDELDKEALVNFAVKEGIDLTFVGPEAPLLDGLVDAFLVAGLRVFGPRQEAALIEGSKAFAKELMDKYNIPTAKYQAFENFNEAKDYIEEKGAPIVIKADGLASGKGVVVAETVDEAVGAARDMLEGGRFGSSGARIVVEEFLAGEEFSLMAFVNGEKVYPMIVSQDHKRLLDGDQGPNTGGMGAYAPVPHLKNDTISKAVDRILKPAATGMVSQGIPFTGILYAGLIDTVDGPKVIEFNARFGDPETQVVLPLLENDLAQVLMDVLDGCDPKLTWKNGAALGVVVASKGYPGEYSKGVVVPGIFEKDSSFAVFAGVGNPEKGDGFVSDGGRVLMVGAVEPTLLDAQKKVYEVLGAAFDGNDDFVFRKDIGHRALRREKSIV